jgi:ribosomal protein L37AE/L43A
MENFGNFGASYGVKRPRKVETITTKTHDDAPALKAQAPI